jgi:hypothetical protein
MSLEVNSTDRCLYFIKQAINTLGTPCQLIVTILGPNLGTNEILGGDAKL